MIYVGRASGLLVSFDVPELTLPAAIERGWEMGPGVLLLPRQPEYLPTYPARYLPGSIPWPDPWTPWTPGRLIQGLPTI